MARSFVSPGVFTNEIDASFLGPGVGAIGASLIGTAKMGPAHVPVTVTTFSEFTDFFGDLNEDHLLTYAAKAYLKNAATANIVRVLGPEGRTVNGTAVTPGYSAESIWSINAFSGTSGAILGTLEITGSHDLVITDLGNDKFFVSINAGGTDEKAGFTASFLTSSELYVKKVLNTNPTEFETAGYYLRDTYTYAFKSFGNGNGDALYGSSSFPGMVGFEFGFNSGSTSIIKSQPFGGTAEYDLFKIHTLTHGEVENGRWKVSIENIRPSPAPSITEFGKFDIVVRNFNDTDKNRSIVEAFPNLSFDVQDAGYICRAIGDRFLKFDPERGKMVEFGNFANRSKTIRIELMTGSNPDAALPWGFRGLDRPDLSISGALAPEIANGLNDLPLVADLLDKGTQSEASTGIYWGVEFTLSGSVQGRTVKYPKMTGSDADFSLKNVSGSALANLVYNASNPTDNHKQPGDSTTHTTLEDDLAKFTLPFAFGFDGFDRRIENPLENETQLLGVSQIGTQALRQAVDIISDPDFIDINLVNIPGIFSSKVVEYTIDTVTERADAFYVADITGSTPTAVISEVKGRGFDNNYTGIYYPCIKVFDPVNKVAKELPASIAAIGCIAFNDRVAQPWFAPAGLNRAGLGQDTIGFDVLTICDQLTQDERDSLYENRINPIARFPDVPQGVVWGQKTLQLKASALDRINVRRLLIRAKKLVASAVKFLVFEPNNGTTQTRFRQLVNPILADIQQKQGLEAFKVVMDETTNPPELIDRNVMAGKIFLIPTRAAEFISIDFIISPTGASFDE